MEGFLFTHPDIAQAQVFGIPDTKYEELVCIWIVPAAGVQLSKADVREFSADKIAHFKVPTHIRIKSDLTMTVTGKPQKFIMRDQTMDDLQEATVG